MNPKTMQPLSPKHSDGEWGSCQDLSIASCKTTNGTATAICCGVVYHCGNECFDGILDLIHGLVTTLIGGIKGTVVFQYKQEGCCATKIQNKGL